MTHRTLSLFLVSVAALFAADTKGVPSSDGPPPQRARVVYEHEGDIGHIYCRQKEECAIIAPDGEKFVARMIGDPSFWPDSVDSLPSRLYSVRPSFGGQKTTLHLTTDHDNVYAFVVEESGKFDPDITTILKSDDLAVKKRIAAPPVVVPYADYQRAKDGETAALEALKQARQDAVSQKEQAVSDIKKDLPASMRTYEYDRAEAAKYPWQVSEILTDGKFTYITRPASAGDLPSVYGIGANGKPEIIIPQYDPDRGQYVITRSIHDGYLSFGSQKKDKKKLVFHLRDAG